MAINVFEEKQFGQTELFLSFVFVLFCFVLFCLFNYREVAPSKTFAAL